MKKLTGAVLGAVLTTALLAAGPAYADRGDRGDRGYNGDRGSYHDRGHDRHQWKHARKHQKHHVVRRDVHHYYETYQPAPVYYAPPAPFGISVILPNIFIPIR